MFGFWAELIRDDWVADRNRGTGCFAPSAIPALAVLAAIVFGLLMAPRGTLIVLGLFVLIAVVPAILLWIND